MAKGKPIKRNRPMLTPLALQEREMIISSDDEQTRIAFLENGRLAEYYGERHVERTVVGNIYKGVVSAVLPGLQAAFIDIGLEKSGFLHARDVLMESMTIEDYIQAKQASRNEETLSAEEAAQQENLGKSPGTGGRGSKILIQNMLKRGDEILVQIEKEPISTKGPRITGQISLPSRLVVLIPQAEHVGVSHRIADESERSRLKKILDALVPKDFGVIARTSAVGATESELKSEISYLVKLWKKIKAKEKKMHAPAVIHAEGGLLQRVARDMLNREDNRIIIDAEAEGRKLKQSLGSMLSSIKPNIELYKGDQPIFEALNLETEIEKALRPKVWLKCGGYLVIEETEALVVVDVNTGRNVGKGHQDETIFKTNMEAAEEIGRQLRLRDLGGIIVLDFIDMRHADHKERLFKTLSKILTRDRAKTSIRRLTDLGLIQMTRKRVRSSLLKTLCVPCPVCQGRGWISSRETVRLKLKRAMERARRLTDESAFQLEISPHWRYHIGEEALLEQGRSQKIKLAIVTNADLRTEEFRLLSSATGLVIVGND